MWHLRTLIARGATPLDDLSAEKFLVSQKKIAKI